MKHSMYVGMAALAVAAIVAAGLVYAEGEATAATCPCPRHGGSTVMKEAKVAVQNTAEGVTITVTAANLKNKNAEQPRACDYGKGMHLSLEYRQNQEGSRGNEQFDGTGDDPPAI